ncbi:MAG TPA: TRAP transporter TatT component family protein [Gammaproteobacteria bacterium]
MRALAASRVCASELGGAMRRIALAAVVIGGVAVSGCTGLVGSMAADTLSAAILDQEDPALIEEGAPAYLLLLDGFISRSPDDTALLAAGAQLYALYGSRFAADPERAIELTTKARRYGTSAMCHAYEWACSDELGDYETYVEQLSRVTRRDIDLLYAYAVSWLAHLDATSEDWAAVAELPWVEAALERVLELDETYAQGAVHGYLGTLNALRPPALGGKPEVARQHFERAIELSGGRDLSVKVEYARRYARLVFDQELHDRLLREVLEAPTEAPGLTLFNALAKEEAEQLLATSEDYF